MAVSLNVPTGMSTLNSHADRLSSANSIGELFFHRDLRRCRQRVCFYRSSSIVNSIDYGNRDPISAVTTLSPNGSVVTVSSILFVCVCVFI